MFLITLTIEDISSGIDGIVVSNVGVVSDLKEVTTETLEPIAEKLCDLACSKEFMRKEAK